MYCTITRGHVHDVLLDAIEVYFLQKRFMQPLVWHPKKLFWLEPRTELIVADYVIATNEAYPSLWINLGKFHKGFIKELG